MTKEELEKEVEDYAKKLLEGTEFEDDDVDVCAYTKREILEAILHFAEPREKRIAELEAQIEKMKNCRNCKKFMIEGVCGHFLQVGWCKNWELVD